MSNDSAPSLPPFPSSYRASGLLLHVTSLPSPYGIGDVGPVAIAWIDQLSDCRTRLVAGIAIGPDRLRQLSLSIAVVLRRQWPFNQSRLAHRGWLVTRQ